MSENKIEISASEIEAMQQAMLNSKEEIFIEEGRMTLRTEGLVKKYGERTVANNVSINVKQGEIVGLLGPNGAGKTTTFYMTTGLIVPNAGRRSPKIPSTEEHKREWDTFLRRHLYSER